MNNNKTKTAAITSIVFAMILTSPVYANHIQSFPTVNFSNNNVTDAEINIVNASFANPGLLPTSPFYFIKRFSEDLTLMLAPPRQKARLYEERAYTRLAETKKLLENNMTVQAERTATDFAEEMRHIENTTEMNEMLKKSAIALELVRQNAPDNAKPAMERAFNKTQDISQRMEDVRERMRERMRKEVATDDGRLPQNTLSAATVAPNEQGSNSDSDSGNGRDDQEDGK